MARVWTERNEKDVKGGVQQVERFVLTFDLVIAKKGKCIYHLKVVDTNGRAVGESCGDPPRAFRFLVEELLVVLANAEKLAKCSSMDAMGADQISSSSSLTEAAVAGRIERFRDTRRGEGGAD
jgi:hypothetical protein